MEENDELDEAELENMTTEDLDEYFFNKNSPPLNPTQEGEQKIILFILFILVNIFGWQGDQQVAPTDSSPVLDFSKGGVGRPCPNEFLYLLPPNP